MSPALAPGSVQLEIEAHRVVAGLPVPAFRLDNACRGVPSGWPKALVPLANPTDSYTTKKERTYSSCLYQPDHESNFQSNSQDYSKPLLDGQSLHP